MTKVQKFREKDSGYSWLVLVAAFVSNMIVAGFVSAPALLLVEWYSVFNRSTAVVAWLPGLSLLTRSLAGLFAGGLITRFGCRVVMIGSSMCACAALLCCAFSPNFELLAVSFSVFGFCHGFMYDAPMVVIYEYFDKYNSLASGLSMCGHSLSSFTMVILYRYSIDYYGWRGAMMIMAGVALNGCVCGMTFVPNNERMRPNSQAKKSSMFAGLMSWNYMLFIMANCANKCQLNVLLLLTTSRAVSKGLSVMQGSMLISCIGIASTVTRFFVSWVSNMKCTSHIALYAASVIALSGLMVVSCIQPANMVFIATATALCGTMFGTAATMYPATMVDIVGQSWLATGLGVSNALTVINTFIMPAAGFVYDQTGDFNNSFYLAAAIGFLGGCCALVVVLRTCLYKSSAQTELELPQMEVGQSAGKAVFVDETGSQVLYGSKPSLHSCKG